ncbi:MAG: type III secretion system cytoplasmic ring protein SctQ, partial [Parachlamydiaceae bacterium]
KKKSAEVKPTEPAPATASKPKATESPKEPPKTVVPKEPVKESPKAPLSVDEIPLSVVIEVGRIQMSVKKLLELQPGNMLDLDIHPESGVDLVVNGKRIAKGELLRIGDVLGIRIMEL